MREKLTRDEVRQMSCLTIFIRDNSVECGAAIDLASRIKKRLPDLELEVINVDRGKLDDASTIFVNEEPVFLLGNEVLHVGNPDEDELVKALLEFDRGHLN